MAFKLGNTTVIHDPDATAAVESTSDVDILKINGTDVLVHDGTTITLKNVDIANDAIEGRTTPIILLKVHNPILYNIFI